MRKLKYSETRVKVNTVMADLDARLLNECAGPNRSTLTFWSVGGHCVIVQFWSAGGCSHYVPGHGSTWDAMETQLHQLAAN